MFRLPSFVTLAFLLATTPFLTGRAEASSLLVAWGGKYTDAYAALNAGASSTSGGTTNWAWSDTTPINPAGPTFYGAFRLSNSSGTGTPAFRANLFGLGPASGNDTIRLSAAAASGTLTMRGLIYFKKEDFLLGGGPITFDETSSIALNVTSSTGASRSSRIAVYAQVEGGWGWYLSEASFAGTTLNTLTNVGGRLWAPYVPNGSELLPSTPASSAYSIAGSAFQDIGAVGVFINYTQAEGSNATIYFNSFEVQAVPEPSSVAFAMIAAGLFGVAGLRLRKAAR